MQAVQVKMARAALGLSVDQLAARAGVSHNDVAQAEVAGNAFESAGIEWVGDDGVRFKAAVKDDATIPVEDLNSANDE